MKTALILSVLVAMLVGSAGAANTMTVRAPWSRPAIGTGVVYLTIANTSATPDRLVAVRSPIANAVELHESTEAMASMQGAAMAPVASMHGVAFVPIPAHGTVSLAPGGYHIMLIGLHHDLHADQTFPIRLHFAKAGWLGVTVRVRPI